MQQQRRRDADADLRLILRATEGLGRYAARRYAERADIDAKPVLPRKRWFSTFVIYG